MIGLIGLGNMGLAMAGRLVASGHAPLAFDLDPARRQLAVAAGAQVVESAAATAADLVLLSLPDEHVVAAVLEVLLPAMPRGGVIADTSTLDPIAARRFAAAAERQGVAYLDAPVSGGPAGAAAGMLAMMVGGAGGPLDAARPDLSRIADRILHVGEAGAGQVAKLVNNLLVATHLVAAAEALRLGTRAGVAPEALLAVINAASGRSAATEVNWPRWILNGRFDSGFSAGLMRKDIRLAGALATSVGAPMDVCDRAVTAWGQSGIADDADFNRVAAAIFEGSR